MEQKPEWELLGSEWPETGSDGSRWDHPSVALAMTAALPEFTQAVQSTDPLGFYPLAPRGRSESGHNISMTFGYVLARAAHGKTRLSVLDWGGAIGFYAIMAEALLPEVELEISIKERPQLCRVGSELLPGVTFIPTDDVAFGRTYDLVIASTSLQYAEDWRLTLSRLANSASQWLFVTRVHVVRDSASFTMAHRPRSVNYQTEYLQWVISRNELLSHARTSGVTLEREFIAGAPMAVHGSSENVETVGFLFKKTGIP